MTTLVNVDPLNPQNRPEPYKIRDLGLGGVRIVPRPGVEDYVDWCHRYDLFVLAVLARESEGNILGGMCDAYQVGNEPDGTGESSWTMTPARFIEECRIYRETYPDLFLIAGGLVSGNTNYWSAVGPTIARMGYDGFAVHPYGKTPDQAEALLKRYQAITPKLRLWVTEWNRPAREIPDFKAMLRRIGCAGDAWFCWSYADWDLWPDRARALRVAA